MEPFKARCTVALFQTGPLHEYLCDHGYDTTVVALPSSLQAVTRQAGLGRALRSVPAMAGLVRRIIVQARSHDVIYANSQKALVVSALAGFIARRPVIWHLRDILTGEHFSAHHIAAVTWLSRFLVTRVLANSEATAGALRRAGGPGGAIHVCYPGIDPAPFEVARETDPETTRSSLNIPPGAPLVGVFSRISPWKGQHVLIRAATMVPRMHVLVVGTPLFGEQAYLESLQAQVAREHLADRIHFVGFRNDVPQLMHACDVVCHTSTDAEPFGRVIVEAMLSGAAVVATDAGGPREIIRDGVDGILVPPDSAPALARALMGLFDDPDLRRRLAEAGEVRARTAFSKAGMQALVERHVAEVGRS